MKYTALFIILALAGCQAVTDGWQVERAHRTCENKSGVAEMGEDTVAYYGWIRCNDGTYIRFTSGGN